MGLIIKCKKTGTAYSLGYSGFMMLRIEVATCLDKEYGDEFAKVFVKTPPDKRNCDKLNEIATQLIRKKQDNVYICNFMAQDDVKGSIKDVACKTIYDCIKDKCEDFVIGYAGQENPFTWNQFIELLKECYENKSDLVWE